MSPPRTWRCASSPRSASPARAATWSNMPARRCARCRSNSRMTLCNLNIEMGGRSGFVAPDESTFSWIAGRPFAPQGAMWDRALAHWRTLASDDGAAFDREHVLDCSGLEPQITWGTDPSQVLGISGRVPDPRPPTRAGAPQSKARSPTWGSSPAWRSPACRSTACSSARAPTAACRTCKPRPTWCAAATSPKASSRWSCRARRA